MFINGSRFILLERSYYKCMTINWIGITIPILLILRQKCIVYLCKSCPVHTAILSFILYFRICGVRCGRKGAPPHCIEQEDEASSFIERSPRCDHINDLLIGLTSKWASQPSSVHNRFDNMHRLHGN